MKRLIFAAASVLVLAACAKESAVESPSGSSGDLVIKAGLEDTKAYLEAGVIKWKTSDILTVFDTSNDGVDFTAGTISDDKKSCDFSTNSWTGKIPAYASSYNAEYGESRVLSCTSSGIVPVRVRKTQNNHSWKGCSSPFANASVGIVSKVKDEYIISGMKNVVGYIGITLSSSTTKKITVESLGDEPLAGWVDVNYSKLVEGDAAFWTLREGQTGDKTITLSVSSGGSTVGGCFGAGTYYVGLLPQKYSKGIKITCYNADDEVLSERTVGAASGLTIKRSVLTPISGNADVMPVVLPDEIILDIDFSGGNGTNPLGFTTISSYSTNGESYNFTYNYTEPGTGLAKSIQVPFVFKGTSANTYAYQNVASCTYSSPSKYVLNMVKGSGTFGASIQLPVFDGRYLSSIGIALGNGFPKTLALKESLQGNAVLQTEFAKSESTGPVVTTLKFYTNGITHEGGKIMTGKGYESYVGKLAQTYYLMPAATLMIGRLTLTYTKTLPTK